MAREGNGWAGLVREHLSFIATHGPTYRLLFNEMGRVASRVDIASGVEIAIISPIRQALRDGQADGSREPRSSRPSSQAAGSSRGR